jgi:two-component system nitrogen regulation response regulator NtrX
MGSGKKTAILAYNGVDGACAAAVALLAYPRAEVLTASARGIGETFEELAHGAYAEVHVCGLGVWCPWERLETAARAMKRKGTRIVWYCGRGYLDADRGRFAGFCTPCFEDAGTNTEGVARALEITDRITAHLLMNLARCDRHVPDRRAEGDVTPEERDWLDLLAAAMGQYFKYQDRAPYIDAIRKLAANTLTSDDRRVIDGYRRTGNRYVLHGRSAVMNRLRERIQRCGDVDRHVVITGESGVGKEHVAQLLRERSRREMGPFIAVNCALYAGSAALANSDLFGHVRGAFTGATGDRRGKFAEADTGFLYLDEIGDLPLEVQAKLLRVLEDGWVTPEGADQPRQHVNVRVVAATNKELPELLRKGEFRADLYHRLATLRIHVPPLRERLEDIQPILEQRLDALREEGYPHEFSLRDYEVFRAYSWPGNVRQLIKLVDRTVLLGITPAEAIAEERALGELVAYGAAEPAYEADGRLWPERKEDVLPLKEVQRRYARRVWELHGRNYTRTADALGIKPNTLRYTHLAEKK